MKLDPTTESIAHFIGLFELAVEELRLRQDYLEFRLKQAEANQAPVTEIVGVRLTAPYALGGYEPELAYDPGAPDGPQLVHVSVELPDVPEVPSPPAAPAPPSHEVEAIAETVATIVPQIGFALAPPGSLVAVTLQSANLYDNDLLLSGLGTSFTSPEALQSILGTIVAQAEALVGFAILDLAGDADWMAFAREMLGEIEGAESTVGPAEMHAFRGEDAAGLIVDGAVVEEVEEAPEWTDLLPLYLRPEDALADEATEDDPDEDGATLVSRTESVGGTGETEVLSKHDFSRDFGTEAPDPFALDPGHEVVAGANKAINEIAVASSWIDAPMIVVRGDVAKIDAISQVNVLVEHDTIDGVATDQGSTARNVAEITETSSRDPAEPQPSSDVLPEAWQVVRVEADLVQVNWVKQFTFATDFDRAEVTFSGQSTFIGLGENEIVNSAVLNELGYHFDLIFVGGDMIDATIVSQKNVLFDSDKIVTSLYGGADPRDGTITAPELDTDPHAAPATDPAPAAEVSEEPDDQAWAAAAAAENANGAEPPSSGQAGVTATPETVEAQVSLRDAAGTQAGPGPAPDLDALPDEGERDVAASEDPAADEIQAQPALSVADNLLYNQATLKQTGIDTFAEMTEAFAATAETLAEGAETIAREVAQDLMFAGKEALRVLQVDGSLAKINVFEQTNIVGDADQIRLEIAALRDQLEGEFQLIAGSNALVNLASAIEHGVDSTIMAGGRVYDDAFIHQAELFDVDAGPSGVKLSGLANEAIAAFLTEDTIAAELGDGIAPTANYEAPSQVDVMQTALA